MNERRRSWQCGDRGESKSVLVDAPERPSSGAVPLEEALGPPNRRQCFRPSVGALGRACHAENFLTLATPLAPRFF